MIRNYVNILYYEYIEIKKQIFFPLHGKNIYNKYVFECGRIIIIININS